MANKVSLLAPAEEFIDKYGRFAIFTHLTPDGDALGSSYALCELLRGMGKAAVTVLMEPPPTKYAFAQFSDLYGMLEDATVSDFEACIAVDCAGEKRLAQGASFFRALPTLNIDHHVSNEGYADINCVSESPATAQLIYDLYVQMGRDISIVAAAAIYMGIIADTGNLTYPSTSQQTFEICARLSAMGLDTSSIAEQVFNRRSVAATKLIGLFIRNLHFYAQDRIAISFISKATLSQLHATSSDTEALVNYARDVETVEVAAFLRETSRGAYKVSLRSKGAVDVSAFASAYGGGGHPRAAGCMIYGRRDEIERDLATKLEVLLA